MLKSNSPMKRRKRVGNMDAFDNVLINAAEFIRGRLYFVSLNTEADVDPKSTPSVYYFTIDFELNYDSFYLDFGPLNLAMLYHYCVKLKRKLTHPALLSKKIVHYTRADEKNRVNAAFLIGAYSIIYLNFDPEHAYEILNRDSTEEYLEFRDASNATIGEPYTITLLDCLRAIKKAHQYGFFNFDSFDFLEYEHYERVENGDFNWILPNKFIAFCGPHNKSRVTYQGYPVHSPETYFAYFRRHKVTTIVRLNRKAYDSNRFVQGGFDHKDLYFVDGGTPSEKILTQFLNICESAKGAIAVHCKAGLGRTGSLIACYIMKHYKFTAEEAIAWIRICRPGSIIGYQQSWLKENQNLMWEAGEAYRKRHGVSGPMKHASGIYSLSDLNRNKNHDNVTGIMKKVDCMEIKDPEDEFEASYEENKFTQGDKLNEIKAQRIKAKPLGTNMSDHKTTRTKSSSISSTEVVTTTVLRGGKVLSNNVTNMGATTTRVLTKRIEAKESQATRRASQRKVPAILSPPANDKTQIDLKRPVRKNNTPWLVKNGNSLQNGTCLSVTDNKSIIKRGKRTLALERDKTNPRSIKVLRRSHGQLSKDIEKTDTTKLRLPSVKMNKTV